MPLPKNDKFDKWNKIHKNNPFQYQFTVAHIHHPRTSHFLRESSLVSPSPLTDLFHLINDRINYSQLGEVYQLFIKSEWNSPNGEKFLRQVTFIFQLLLGIAWALILRILFRTDISWKYICSPLSTQIKTSAKKKKNLEVDTNADLNRIKWKT